MIPFESLGTVSYSHSIATMAISLVISEIFSVIEWPDLKTWIRRHSRSFKLVPFESLGMVPYTTHYWSAIVTIALSCTVSKIE